MSRSIKTPIPEIDDVCRNLSAAVDAHISGKFQEADNFFRLADCRTVWNWVNPAWGRPDLNVKIKNPVGDTSTIPKSLRDPDRNISKEIRSLVLERDGFRCRYCGIPVVSADVRKLARQHYPDAVPWHGTDPSRQHAGFQCLWLQYDHVVPHSHGGRSIMENVVISCALCNFGKDRYTLLQLDLDDPRLRSPEPTLWDGLERLRTSYGNVAVRNASSETMLPASMLQGEGGSGDFFIPGAWISKGYVYTPVLDGKSRWFAISDDVRADLVLQGDVSGVRLRCSPAEFIRRGMKFPEKFIYLG